MAETASGVVHPASWFLVRLAWIALAIPVAFGSAGLVTGLDHRPGSTQREELTWAADQVVTPRLDAITGDLNTLAADFDALSEQGRTAIASLMAADPKALNKAIAAGQVLVDRITAELQSIRRQLSNVPYIDDPSAASKVSPSVLDRARQISAVLDATGGFADSWSTLSTGALAASQLAQLLVQHDQYAGQAVLLGSEGKYLDAVHQLDEADPTLQQARALRDAIANTSDVSVLTQWLDRNAAIDTALRRLYTILTLTNGTMTPDANVALADVRQAQQLLPPDTRALIVVMASIAQGGLNQAVISIEEARGRLHEALDSVNGAAGSSASAPSGSAGPSASNGPAPSG